jgi:predicted metal-dependent TIM-barrel fold hydrolase
MLFSFNSASKKIMFVKLYADLANPELLTRKYSAHLILNTSASSRSSKFITVNRTIYRVSEREVRIEDCNFTNVDSLMGCDLGNICAKKER